MTNERTGGAGRYFRKEPVLVATPARFDSVSVHGQHAPGGICSVYGFFTALFCGPPQRAIRFVTAKIRDGQPVPHALLIWRELPQ